MMVGRRFFPFGIRSLFSGELLKHWGNIFLEKKLLKTTPKQKLFQFHQPNPLVTLEYVLFFSKILRQKAVPKVTWQENDADIGRNHPTLVWNHTETVFWGQFFFPKTSRDHRKRGVYIHSHYLISYEYHINLVLSVGKMVQLSISYGHQGIWFVWFLNGARGRLRGCWDSLQAPEQRKESDSWQQHHGSHQVFLSHFWLDFIGGIDVFVLDSIWLIEGGTCCISSNLPCISLAKKRLLHL